MNSTVIKVILSIAALALLAFVCYWLLIILAFGGEHFYMALLAVAFFLLLALIPLSVFGVFTKKTGTVLWLSFAGIVMLPIIARESVRTYHNSFEKLTEYRVDLSKYAPFKDGTLAATLGSESSLKLTDSLPRLDGATALYPVYAAFAQAVYPEKEYNLYDSEVVCRTTAYAYNALIEGEADIIFVLYPSAEQREYADSMGIEMVLTPIGREAFVFFVNSENPVSELSTQQLKEIYSGRISNWRDVGGRSRKIRAFQRETGSGSQTAFLKFMQGTDVMTPPQNNVVYGMGEIIDRTASYTNYPNAIGYTFRFYAESMVGNDGIKLLKVDGVYPSNETVKRREYPLAAEFYAVTRAGETNPDVGLLIDWILSPQGQSLIEKTGYNPIK